MTQEQFHKYQENIFDSFCMTVIENTRKSIQKQLSQQGNREKSLFDLTPDEFAKIAVSDAYELDAETFSIDGETITIHNPTLAQALRSISPKLREIIFLLYFLDKSESQIGRMLNMGKSGVSRRHITTLRRLRKIMEELEHE